MAGLAGLTLVSLSRQWWLIAVGALCVAGAWFYTGGKRPYGYAGLGEVAVFVFFGPVAVLGTTLTQSGPPNALAIVSSIGVGMLTCAVLVANNLRDIPTDETVGKRTLAVILGDRDTRRLYAALVLLPFLLTALGGLRSWPVLLGLLALPAAVLPVRKVLAGADGRALIRVLGQTGLLLLAWSVLTGVGLALGTARLSVRRASSPRSRARSTSRWAVRRSCTAARPASIRLRRPRRSSIDSGSAATTPMRMARTSGTPASTSSPATAATRQSRARV